MKLFIQLITFDFNLEYTGKMLNSIESASQPGVVILFGR